MSLSNFAMQPAEGGASSDWAFKQLFSLESECRSSQTGQQVRALGQFPKLLDTFPFPTLVTSAFLKLGDLFRGGTNALRYHIVQVFERAHHHLPRVTHTDELLKRILTVLYSNDPVARVLALQAIGSASIVFAEYTEAQHGLLLRYQSTHPLEIAAAVRTTECMLEYSPQLLEVVWETVVARISDESVPDSVRAQVVLSLKHAAGNLQLSTSLLEHCRKWALAEDSPTAVRVAAMATVRAIVQQHNRLTLEDAVAFSALLGDSGAGPLGRAALGVLGKWRPSDMLTDEQEAQVKAMRRRLVNSAQKLMGATLGNMDLSNVRLVVLALARIEATYGICDGRTSWELTDAMYNWSFGVLCGQYIASRSAWDLLDSADSNYDVTTPYAFSEFSHLRLLSASTMLAVNVATVRGSTDDKIRASDLIVKTWKAVASSNQTGSHGRYTKQLLKTTWKWAASMGTTIAILGALDDMLTTASQAMHHTVLAIAAESTTIDDIELVLLDRISWFASTLEQGADGLEPGRVRAAWLSTAAILCFQAHAAPYAERGNGMPGLRMIERWSELTRSQQPLSYRNSGPPAYVTQRIITLLASVSAWATLSEFVSALPAAQLSSRQREHIDCVHSIAKAESHADDHQTHQLWNDRALNSLSALNNKGVGRQYQSFLVQLQGDFVQAMNSWTARAYEKLPMPLAAHAKKALSQRLLTVATEADAILCSFMQIDRTTLAWLRRVQSALGSVIAGGTHVDMPMLALGPSFFVESANPHIAISTRPTLEAGDSARAVLAGSEFHLAVEGFVDNILGLVGRLQGVCVAVWLAQQPLNTGDGDLETYAQHTAIAQSRQPTADMQDPTEICWEQAIQVMAPLKGTFFECGCAVPMPQLAVQFGQLDTNIRVHLHISCALVDNVGRKWWVGPHKSFPLVVSTTFRA